MCVNDFWLVRSPLNLMDNSENQLQNDSESPVIATLTVDAKFQSFTELKNALDCFQKANFCQFYVRDSRTLQQVRKFSPKLIQTVPEELKYTFVNYSCIYMEEGVLRAAPRLEPGHSKCKLFKSTTVSILN